MGSEKVRRALVLECTRSKYFSRLPLGVRILKEEDMIGLGWVT